MSRNYHRIALPPQSEAARRRQYGPVQPMDEAREDRSLFWPAALSGVALFWGGVAFAAWIAMA